MYGICPMYLRPCHKGGAPRRYSVSRPVLWWLPKPDALAYPWPTENEGLVLNI